MSKIEVSAFRWVPPFAQGLVRDLRVRWALEEAGRPYVPKLIGFEDQNTPAYRALQPFGQVPVFEEDGLVLFESGAIVLHIAEDNAVLMPADEPDRAHVKTWMFAALNSIEPTVMMLNVIDMHPAASGADVQALRATVLQRAQGRLDGLATVLGAGEYLVGGRFSAADLLMTTVLRALRNTDLLARMPTLEAYRLRCEARPAFQKALAAQLQAFAEHAPAESA